MPISSILPQILPQKQNSSQSAGKQMYCTFGETVATGMFEGGGHLPAPAWPTLLRPQHSASELSARIPQVWPEPAEILGARGDNRTTPHN